MSDTDPPLYVSWNNVQPDIAGDIRKLLDSCDYRIDPPEDVMEAIIFRSDDIAMLDELVRNTRCPQPYRDESGRRIGNVLRIWREGKRIKADIECVPGDGERSER
jgi:hypothetical protein